MAEKRRLSRSILPFLFRDESQHHANNSSFENVSLLRPHSLQSDN